MQQHSNLLNLLIDFLAIDIPQSAERETKINEIKKSALTREQKTIFYMQDYNISKNPFSLNPNNFTVYNRTHDYLNIIICDEVISINLTSRVYFLSTQIILKNYSSSNH